MMNLIGSYIRSYKGLAREVWILALVVLINRSGLMVTTYLSVYMHTHLGYSIAKSGSIMIFYGLGSVLGVLVSGAISDKVGYLKMQFIALVVSGIFIFNMQFVDEYWGFAILLFLAVFFADLYRPANMASLTQFSVPENRTRSLALLRLAINLGISIGPLIGGVLIGITGYKALFYVDGLTCIGAGIVLISFLGLKDKEEDVVKKNAPFPWKEVDIKSFLWLLFANLFWTISFFQIIYSYPLFMKADLNYSELIIGLTFTLNGLMIFVMEMPIIKMYEQHNKRKLLYWGTMICALAFIFLYISEPTSVFLPMAIFMPVMYMVFITIGEIFYLPFVGAYALNIAPKGHTSKFMGFYSLIFSIAHISGPILGPGIADKYGFDTLWLIMGIAMLIVFIGISQMKDEPAQKKIEH